MRTAIVFTIVVALATLSVAETTEVVTDAMRADIAVAQRDYLLAKMQLQYAQTLVEKRITEAQTACTTIHKTFSMDTLKCEGKK